ncbi:flagellar FlbD family protein [Natroniella acetigena]|uniref:flagellar FlbD family protein n=1 Tax=Natroniella acetigena TaxID=52004 RepID=UPI0031F6A58F
MIKLRRLNDSEIVVNAELIETIEATPDTVITLTTNHRLIVKEDVDDIIEMIIDYKRRIRLKPEWE